MTIETIGTRTVLRADAGRFIVRKGSNEMIESVSLAPSDAPENWEDTDGKATEADKDAALTTLGVDMTEG